MGSVQIHAHSVGLGLACQHAIGGVQRLAKAACSGDYLEAFFWTGTFIGADSSSFLLELVNH